MKIFNIAEKVFSVLSILFFSDAIFSVLLEQDVSFAKALRGIVYFLILIFSSLLVFIYRHRIYPILFKEKLLWIFLLIALASILWSEYPPATLKHILTVIEMTTFSIYFVGRFNLNEQLRLICYAFGLASLLSLLFCLAFPSYGVMGVGVNSTSEGLAHYGVWRGIYTHKNTLGRMMALTVLSFICLSQNNWLNRLYKYTCTSLAIFLLIVSTSKTSMLTVITLFTLLPFYKAMRWTYRLALPFFIAIILVSSSSVTLAIDNLDAFTSVLGKDITLTGRTGIWGLVLLKIADKPWLGYGYHGFWNGWDGESADIWRVLKWECPHSHNGFLDLTLDLGLIGLAVFILTFLAACLRSIMLMRKTRDNTGIFPILYLTFMLLVNLTESSIVTLNSIWVVFVIVVLSTHTVNDPSFIRKNGYRTNQFELTQ